MNISKSVTFGIMVLMSIALISTAATPTGATSGGQILFLVPVAASFVFLLLGLMRFPLGSVQNVLLLAGAMLFMYLGTSLYLLPLQTVSVVQNVPLSCTANAPIVNYTNWYLTPTNSLYNLTDHFYNLSSSNYHIYSYLNFSNAGQASGLFKVAQFLTPVLNETQMNAGNYQIHLHASSSGQVQLSGQIWVIAPNDNNVFEIGDVKIPYTLTTNDSEYIATFHSNQTVLISPNDRIALFVFENSTAFSVPFNTTLYFGGIANPHISLPTYYNQNNVCPTTNETTYINPSPSGATVRLVQDFSYIYMLICVVIAIMGLLLKHYLVKDGGT